MAKQKRKPATPPVPLTRHPAFPAVVALWFGALFGLGSLAIRPGLIEALVLKVHLDTLIPAAAPPLGVTARICIALALAIFGGLLGAKLARFITRPKPDAHQRKRGAATINDTDLRRRDKHPDAPARLPISAHDELGADSLDQDQGPSPIPGRRRALTAEEQEAVFTVPEIAPLPGGEPQVMNLSELDLTGSEIDDFEPLPSAESLATPTAQQDFVAPLDSGAGRQVFGQPVPVVASFAAPAAALEPAAPVANFGAPVAPPIDFSRPHEVISAANAARTEEAPLFQRQSAPPQPKFDAPISVEPVSVESAAPAAPITAEAVAEAAAVALDSLGLVELTERFAATLRKRRAALAASAAAVEVLPIAEPAIDAVPDADTFDVPSLEVPPFTLPVSEVALEPAPQPAFAADPVPLAPLTPEPDAPIAQPASPVLASLSAGIETASPAAEVPPAPLPMPAALRPISFDDHDEDEDFATYLPLRHIQMPQAQPAASVPTDPAPVPVAFAPPADFAAPVVEAPSAATASEVEVSEEQVADGYSSLLEMSKSTVATHQQFVRIDEPEADSAAIEPVVIFPGQAARAGLGNPAPFAQPAAFSPPVDAATQDAEAAALRRFDAPSSAVAGQPVAAPALAPVQNPEETERALRAALATLQRMSGAA